MRNLIKRNWLNLALFIVMSILIYSITMMNSLIDSGKTSSYSYLERQFLNESGFVLQTLHNDFLRDVENKTLDSKNTDQIISYMRKYNNQLKVFNQSIEFYLLDSNTNRIIYPETKRGETYEIVNKTYRLYKTQNIPILQSSDYNYLAVCTIDGINLYPPNLLLGIEKLKQIGIYVLFFNLGLYLVCVLSFSWQVKKNHLYSNHNNKHNDNN